MTELAASTHTCAGPIGPGRLVLVVGPSGAGKDTVIAGAKSICADDPAIVFPQRVVTRPAEISEAHTSVNPARFEADLMRGAFALDWNAHGLHYGIPVAIDIDIRSGHTVVCNVSRAIVALARERYANVVCVMIAAPVELLAARIVARARASDAFGDRIERNNLYVNFSPDIAIENVGAPSKAIDAFVKVLRGDRA